MLRDAVADADKLAVVAILILVLEVALESVTVKRSPGSASKAKG